ncbi:S-adenosylmethionine decarboxylase [Paenibacillus sp. MBLB4367]|uniref:S-adenosylmethionine decarboxylase n=1 Tax=Paenibacillus sp. MBLB4367 TaxID=3384767 RepID=UPI003908379D
MGKLRIGKLFVWLLAGFVILVTLLQLSGGKKGEEGHEDAAHLLFQVSQFQMELLANAVTEAEKAKNTDELNALKQAAYSANYTHERLVMAEGDRLSELASMQQLLQYIVRLQIAGQRALKAEEVQTIQAAGKLYKTMNEDYAKLMSSGGSVISSQNDKLKKTDKAIVEQLRDVQKH